jgi:uncharacterized protein with HEPN domain
VSRRDLERLQDIRDAIRRIRLYLGTLDSACINDQVLADAVVYNLLIIGEAAKHLGDEIRDASREIPWTDIAGMRDFHMSTSALILKS